MFTFVFEEKRIYVMYKYFCIVLMAFVPVNAYSKSDICLATAIYHEANTESLQGKEAVANVILNRVKHHKYPNTVCGVISQKSQFSWYRKVKHNYTDETLTIARKMLNNRRDNTNGALFFHSGKNPYWTRKMKMTKQLGNHKFYRPYEI